MAHPCGLLRLPSELRSTIVDLVLQDGDTRDDNEKKTRFLTSLRSTCLSLAYDPHINSLLFETVALSFSPALVRLLTGADLSHICPHIQHVEFCQTLQDCDTSMKDHQSIPSRAQTKLGRILHQRRVAASFYKFISEIETKTCFRADTHIVTIWGNLMNQAPQLKRISFRYRSLKPSEGGPSFRLPWLKRYLRPDNHAVFCMRMYIHTTQIFFTTVVASLLQVGVTVRELSVQHKLYPSFRWEQIPQWDDLDLSRIHTLTYSSFCSTWPTIDRYVTYPAASLDKVERLENFTSLLRESCHSLVSLTVDAMWYSAADPNEYVVLHWPDDYSLSFPLLTELQLRRVRLYWKQAARYLERMPALQSLSCRDSCQLKPLSGKPLWDIIRARERKPKIETGYLTNSRVIFDPDFDEMPEKYRCRGHDWELQLRKQLWIYLAGKGSWNPLLEQGVTRLGHV